MAGNVWAGVDVGKEHHWVVAVDETGRSVLSRKVANDEQEIIRVVADLAALADRAFDLPHLGHRRRCAAELAKAQRKTARRRRPKGQPQSKGYQQAKRQAARIAKKAARQNTHDARVWAKNITDHHALIAVEDFKPKFLARTTMARKAADAAIGACKKELIERGTRAGRKVVLVPPAYTTMTCSGCGERANLRLGLGVRTFECAACGYTADRDLNAARMILATAERHRASADDVRHLIASFRDGGSGAVRAGNPGPAQEGKSPGFSMGIVNLMPRFG